MSASVAVIGLGAMGSRIASRLVGTGFDVVVWNRTPARAGDVERHGARVAASPAAAAADRDVVITMVTDAPALLDVCSGSTGVLAGMHRSAALVDMSTVGPTAVRNLAQLVPSGVELVDATVLGMVHARGVDLRVGLIGSTPDPRAMRAYARLPGFHLHPTVRAEGPVAVAPTPRLQPEVGGPHALDDAAPIDLAVRGSARTTDLQHLLAQGNELRSIPDRGYVVATDTSIATLAARDDEAASALLEDVLARAVGAELELPRMTSNQPWAIAVAVAAGLRLRPWGPLMVRGLDAPPSPYLPHQALN